MINSISSITISVAEYRKLIKKEILVDSIKYLLEAGTYLASPELKTMLGIKEEETINESL